MLKTEMLCLVGVPLSTSCKFALSDHQVRGGENQDGDGMGGGWREKKKSVCRSGLNRMTGRSAAMRKKRVRNAEGEKDRRMHYVIIYSL